MCLSPVIIAKSIEIAESLGDDELVIFTSPEEKAYIENLAYILGVTVSKFVQICIESFRENGGADYYLNKRMSETKSQIDSVNKIIEAELDSKKEGEQE